jgi:hypothetical protein
MSIRLLAPVLLLAFAAFAFAVTRSLPITLGSTLALGAASAVLMIVGGRMRWSRSLRARILVAVAVYLGLQVGVLVILQGFSLSHMLTLAAAACAIVSALALRPEAAQTADGKE